MAAKGIRQLPALIEATALYDAIKVGWGIVNSLKQNICIFKKLAIKLNAFHIFFRLAIQIRITDFGLHICAKAASTSRRIQAKILWKI